MMCLRSHSKSLARNPVVGLTPSPPFFLLHIKSTEGKEDFFPWLWNIVSYGIPGC